MDAPRKSNRQRREELRNKRLARAEKARVALTQAQAATATQVPLDVRLRGTDGWVAADRHRLAELNNTYGVLPEVYLDTAFACRDCGVEAVWTARQQRWWYEVVGASIWSQAVRCRPCRRDLRGQRTQPGAHRLGEDVAELRLLAAQTPDPHAWERVEAGLASKWSGVRAVAMETLAHWKTDASTERLKTLVEEKASFRFRDHGYQETRAVLGALAIGLREQDTDWYLSMLERWGRDAESAWYAHLPVVPAATLAAGLSEALQAHDMPRVRRLLHGVRRLRDRSLLGPLRERIARLPDPEIRSLLALAWPVPPQS